MQLGKRSRRVAAATLLTILFTNTIAPTVTYALTSGPTAPEATSFEPVDTTDMINLQTGDLTYNVPLLEVPGPEGGYPLSLSYHAGIQPNEDASWVGLGWSLNPGAISRSVNGYPDDWYNPSNSNHVYWSGGSTTTYNVGVSIGLANTPASVSFGLSFSQDTYRGFGIGLYAGVGFKLGNSPLSVGVTVGLSPYGGGYVGGSFGAGKGLGPITGSLGVAFNTNFQSFNAGVTGGVGYTLGSSDQKVPIGGSILGASISTQAGKPSFSVGGLTASVRSTAEAAIQSSSSSWGFDIPIWYGVNLSLGYSKYRYWIDKTTGITAHGSMYASGWSVVDNVAYDGYSLLEDPATKSIVDYPDPTRVQGGAYLDFDMYAVNAQGLGGQIRPYQFQGEVLGQNTKNSSNNALVTYFSPGVTDFQPEFRFVGDFSNSYRQPYTDYSNPAVDLRTASVPFGTPEYGNGDGTYGYPSVNKLAGSRHIVIGAQILPSNAAGYNKSDRYKTGMIDGFSITNESGVTYHFALPAYCWGEEVYQEKISRANGLSFNRGSKPEAYAYTWYLTSITGPDFVDRDNDNKAGVNDWGYWINFEYGKWSNSYVWRNPAQEFHRDEDNEYRNVSMGKKEVYYLNAIRTRSHIALFEKDTRYDGKGASPEIFSKVYTNGTNTEYTSAGMYDVNSSQSLRLSKIYLINANDDIYNLLTRGNSDAYKPLPSFPRSYPCSDCELAGNVFDATDTEAFGRLALEKKSIRVIDFFHDYSLCPDTRNSISINTSIGWENAPKYGKLTLNAVNIRGKEGYNFMPPLQFEYELPAEEVKVATGALTTTSFTSTSADLEVGDLLKQNDIYGKFFGMITGKNTSGGTTTYTLANGTQTFSSNPISVKTTKNPVYNKDAYDMWGMYKGDIKTSLLATNENLARRTTATSNKATDVWSLRRIKTVLGSEISVGYEGKNYSKSILTKNQSLVIQSIEKLTSTTFKITTLDPDYDLRDHFAPGNAIDALLLKEQSVLFLGQDPQPIGYNTTRTPDWSTAATVTGTVLEHEMTLQTSEAMMAHISASEGTVIQGVPAALLNVAKGGNLSISSASNLFHGGGIRVKEIEINEQGVSRHTTLYDYNKPGENVSSGVVSYEPVAIEIDNVASFGDNAKKIYRRELYKGIHHLYTIARELPPPSVCYEYVTVRTEVKNEGEDISRQVAGKMQYQFETYHDNMAGRQVLGSNQSGSNSTRNLVIQKFTGNIGNVKSIIQFDKNGKKLTETIRHYLHDGLGSLPFASFMAQYKTRLAQFFYQGYLQERYSEVKQTFNQPNSADNGVKATLSGREDMPCIPTGETVINYVNGTRTSTETLGFDFYSGAITKTVETDAYGNRFMTETVPAYRKYSALGLKASNGANKHMLTQTTASYIYKVDGSNNKLGLVSGEVTTWSNEVTTLMYGYYSILQNGGSYGNVWRKQAAYNWLPENSTADGLTAIGNFSDFNWTSPGSSAASWKKTSEITLYDPFSKNLEAKDINGNFGATHYMDDSKKIALTGTFCNYYEMVYSGNEQFEDNLPSGLNAEELQYITDPANAHSGNKTFFIYGEYPAMSYTVSTDKLVTGRSYWASVWVKPASGTASDVELYYEVDYVKKAGVSSANSTKKAGDWIQVTLVINGSDIQPGKNLRVGVTNNHTASAYLDDFIFRPLNSNTTAYVYDQFSGELTYTLDGDNLYTKYEYDAGGRLVKTYREKLGVGKFKTSEYTYNYGVTKYLSTAINEPIIRNNCGSMAGTAPVINLPAGAFISYVSLADANEKARRFAQEEANRLGTCTPATTIYVQLEQGNYVSYWDGCINTERCPLKLKFYSDPDGTVPLYVSGLSVTLSHFYAYNGSGGATPVTLVCTGTEKLVTNDLITYYDDPCDYSYVTDAYSIVASPAYTILPYVILP